jgi:outer membrane receptor protein involved in Fe transport
VQLINKYKNLSTLTVTSVSKFEETLDEAPASIYVITEDDIKKRGYLDLEQVFNDLPGFSLSKVNGPGYVLVYPRGYRSTGNDKFILLIDGIENNDLNSDNAVINRQVALSNIKQIEVIYGPASTMYGANAFAAVINIITKNATFSGDNKFSVDIQTNIGTWNTNFVDAMLSKKPKNGSFSITGRVFHSDEMDITNQGYDYSTENFAYLEEFSPLTGSDAQDFINLNGPSSYFDYSASNDIVRLTATGANKMKELDNNFYAQNPNIGANNREDNWFLSTKLKIDKFTFGIESFKTNTGAQPWYPKRIVGAEDLSRWITWNSSIYVKYEKKFNSNLFLTNLASYRLHTIDGATNFSSISTYNANTLDFQDLIDGTSPSLSSTYFYRSSNQLRNELKLFYKKNNFNVVTGLELRQGIFQMNSIRTENISLPNENLPSTTEVGIIGGNHSNKLDIGYFAQGKYSFSKSFSATLGGRVDYNLVRSNGGYGFVFNPRAALVYTKKDKYK